MKNIANKYPDGYPEYCHLVPLTIPTTRGTINIFIIAIIIINNDNDIRYSIFYILYLDKLVGDANAMAVVVAFASPSRLYNTRFFREYRINATISIVVDSQRRAEGFR